MSYKKPNALRIATVLDIAANALGVSDEDDEIVMAAAELRRLHALCDEMGEALEELHARITDHPAYADLDEQGEIDEGGDTAEFSYLARVARAALAELAKWKESK